MSYRNKKNLIENYFLLNNLQKTLSNNMRNKTILNSNNKAKLTTKKFTMNNNRSLIISFNNKLKFDSFTSYKELKQKKNNEFSQRNSKKKNKNNFNINNNNNNNNNSINNNIKDKEKTIRTLSAQNRSLVKEDFSLKKKNKKPKNCQKFINKKISNIKPLNKSNTNKNSFTNNKNKTTTTIIKHNNNNNKNKLISNTIKINNISLSKTNTHNNSINNSHKNTSKTKNTINNSTNSNNNNNIHNNNNNNLLTNLLPNNNKKVTFKNFIQNLKNFFPCKFISLNEISYSKKDLIYSNDICELFKGKCLHLNVCIKVYSKISKLEEKDKLNLQNEILISLLVNHPNIINIIGISSSLDNETIFIIEEYLKKNSLKNYLENKSVNLNLINKLNLIYDISKAIYYLHSREPKILHRDLKSSNILLDNNLNCKLCDFGLSKLIYNNISNYQTNSTSTLYWMSPEFLCDGIFNEFSDIYSFAILIWEIMTRDTVPYKNVNQMDFILGNKEIIDNKRPETNLEIFNECPEIKDLIEKMWNTDWNKRPKIKDVVCVLENIYEKYEEIYDDFN